MSNINNIKVEPSDKLIFNSKTRKRQIRLTNISFKRYFYRLRITNTKDFQVMNSINFLEGLQEIELNITIKESVTGISEERIMIEFYKSSSKEELKEKIKEVKEKKVKPIFMYKLNIEYYDDNLINSTTDTQNIIKIILVVFLITQIINLVRKIISFIK